MFRSYSIPSPPTYGRDKRPAHAGRFYLIKTTSLDNQQPTQRTLWRLAKLGYTLRAAPSGDGKLSFLIANNQTTGLIDD